MTKSELIEDLAMKHTHFNLKDVELSVKMILEHMGQSLSHGERIEIRGFGSFSLHYRAPHALDVTLERLKQLLWLLNILHISSLARNYVKGLTNQEKFR